MLLLLIAIMVVFGSIYFIYVDESISELIKEDKNGNNEVNNSEEKEKPGFEAVFAIAGLLAIAYLVLRQRE